MAGAFEYQIIILVWWFSFWFGVCLFTVSRLHTFISLVGWTLFVCRLGVSPLGLLEPYGSQLKFLLCFGGASVNFGVSEICWWSQGSLTLIWWAHFGLALTGSYNASQQLCLPKPYAVNILRHTKCNPYPSTPVGLLRLFSLHSACGAPNCADPSAQKWLFTFFWIWNQPNLGASNFGSFASLRRGKRWRNTNGQQNRECESFQGLLPSGKLT